MNIKKRLLYSLIELRGRLSDLKATVYHKAKYNHRVNQDVIRVGFIVHETETWDKCKPVYDAMLQNSLFYPMIFVCPSYNEKREDSHAYGYELEFFSSHYNDVFPVYTNSGALIDLRSFRCDYLFYQDPYIVHYPEPIRPDKTCSYAKLCYIPYGLFLLKIFSDSLKTNRRFYGTLSYGFIDSDQDAKQLTDLYASNSKKGLQHFLSLGYPALAEYFSYPYVKEIKRVVWTPRWTFDPSLGKSHFLDYKDSFLSLKRKNPDISLTFRPHPLMFKTVVDEGLMSETEVNQYKQQLNDLGIATDLHSPINEVLQKTDLLITDFSSIIIQFFLTGRPIIYCPCDLEMNDTFQSIIKGIYIANNEAELEQHLADLLSGNDYLFDTRQEIIHSDQFKKHLTSTASILDTLQNDWTSSH